jgi:hypothetical protein
MGGESAVEAEKAQWEAERAEMRSEMARGEDERRAQHAECASQLRGFVLRCRYSGYCREERGFEDF